MERLIFIPLLEEHTVELLINTASEIIGKHRGEKKSHRLWRQ